MEEALLHFISSCDELLVKSELARSSLAYINCCLTLKPQAYKFQYDYALHNLIFQNIEYKELLRNNK